MEFWGHLSRAAAGVSGRTVTGVQSSQRCKSQQAGLSTVVEEDEK
jgi:hypothetical protein